MTSRRFSSSIFACCCSALLGVAGLAAQEAQTFERRYELRFLEPVTADAVAQNQCPEGARPQECQVATVKTWPVGGIIAVVADAGTQARIATALAERDVPPTSRAFQVTLLRADRSGTGVPERLPPAIAKALDDVSAFLPYSGYEVLDAAFLRTTGEGFAEVAGPDGRAYEAHLAFTGAGGSPETADELFVHRFLLREMRPGAPLAVWPAGVPGSAGDVAPRPQPALAPATPKTALSTSFSIAPGETVVVGTSRVDGGDAALVVLLTAIP